MIDARHTLAMFGALLVGCVHPGALHVRADDIADVTERARRQGAYRCAPEELALATAHLELASRELEQGDAPRASEHLALAELNARAALHLSEGEHCLTLPDGERAPHQHDAFLRRSPHAPKSRAQPRRDETRSTARIRSTQPHVFF